MEIKTKNRKKNYISAALVRLSRRVMLKKEMNEL